MAVSNALYTALTGLLIQRYGLDVTGHNIANANTEGYSRQRADITPHLPDYYAFGAIGRGVTIDGVERVVDEFLLTQQRDAISLFSSDQTLALTYSRLEAFFNELSEYDLSTGFDRFFNSLQDLSLNVESDATRSVVVQQALALRDLVSLVYTAMRDYHVQLNNDVVAQVEQVNGLIDEIADLNRQIVLHEGNGNVSANDLRDMRDAKLAELAEMVDITVIEQPGGAVNVTIRGMPLVLLTHAFHLETYNDLTAGGLPTVGVRFEEDRAQFVSRDGKLAATLRARDEVLAGFMDELNQFTAEFIFEFNRVHAQGVGSTIRTSAVSENAAVDTTATLDGLNMGFVTQPGTFRVVNGSVTVAIVALGSGQIDEITVPVDLDGVGGNDDSLQDFVNNFNAAVPAGTVQASIDSLGHLHFDSLNPSATGFYFSGDSSGLLATMGVGGFWSGHDAATMDVNAEILADERLVAAGKTIAPGDTDNLIDLLALRDIEVADGGTKTFEDYYRTIVGRLGTEARRTNDRMLVRNDMVAQLENERQQISGVSLDEEMTKMIQFQRAYQAAARVISVSNEMLETLINRT
ncbi:MAG: flagellar hook-associated protein FlgK [Planctomycetota bacterium]|jgi:flagellar hook-associated protein 1 FlgK